ncbi:hypothetical protein [Streptomyces sp. NPDC090445]|uniref:hypothetical protein n=1 Tax=Streptomyces sp. NPDC090445 TaxID=3365963 RepID=UPI003800DCCA
MLDQTLAALALSGATAVVAAMATEAWEAARTGTARLLGRGEPPRQAAIENQLDADAELVLSESDSPGVRRELVPVWNRRLVAFLRENPAAAGELRALLEEVRPALPEGGAGWVQHVTAHGRGTAFGVQGGDIHYHAGPATPADDEATQADRG